MTDSVESNWPTKGQKLFEEPEPSSHYSFSYVGWGDVATQFWGYIKGYKESADQLVDTAVVAKSIAILDTYVFPIVFLYRQFVELTLKSIYLWYSEDDLQMKRKKISEASHNLATAWRLICPVLWDACSTDQDRETIDVVKDYIQQFQDFDRSSFKFRYPIDKQFHRTLDREQRIDLPNLKKRMDELSQFFDAVEAQLNQLQEWKAEERQLNEDMMYDIPGEDY